MSSENEDSPASCDSSPRETSYTDTVDIETESVTSEFHSSDEQSTVVEVESLRKIPVTRAVNFQEYVREKFARNSKPDFVIIIGNQQVLTCKRSVLELYSGYMRRLECKKGYHELPDEIITADAIKYIYEWMCNDQYELKREGIMEVHAAAKFLEIDSLIDQSWQCITSPAIVEDRAFMLYLEAIFFEMPTVHKEMITRVQKFFLTLVGYQQFVELPFGHVCDMLSSDRLGVNSELEAFYACVRYLSTHWEDRKDRAFEMLRNIRFGLFPPHVLVSFRFKKESPEINRLLENTRVEKLLSQTMHFSIGLGSTPSASLLFKEREWIYDMECDYHSTRSIPAKKRLTYEKFLEHIRFLAEKETHWLSYESVQDVEAAIQRTKK